MPTQEKQLLALNAIVAGATITEAGEKAGVTRQTVHEWLNEPDFRKELDSLRNLRDREVLESLLSQGTRVASTISELLNNEAPAVRLKAAELWLKTTGLAEGGLQRWLPAALTKEELEAREKAALEKEVRAQVKAELGEPDGLLTAMLSSDEARFEAEVKRRLNSRNGKSRVKRS